MTITPLDELQSIRLPHVEPPTPAKKLRSALECFAVDWFPLMLRQLSFLQLEKLGYQTFPTNTREHVLALLNYPSRFRFTSKESIFTRYDLIPSSNLCKHQFPNGVFCSKDLHLLQMWSFLHVSPPVRAHVLSGSAGQQYMQRICPHCLQCLFVVMSENFRWHCMQRSVSLFGRKKLSW